MLQLHRHVRLCSLHAVLAWALFLLTSLVATSAGATVMRYADIERLVELSDAVVHATVEARRTHIGDDRSLWTETTVIVHHTFMGAPQQTLVFYQWGGRRANRTDTIPGDPELEVGQELILFLRRDDQRRSAPGELTLAALAQSVFTVEVVAGDRLIRRNLSELSFLVTEAKGTQITKHSDPAHHWTAFIEILEGHIEARQEAQ